MVVAEVSFLEECCFFSLVARGWSELRLHNGSCWAFIIASLYASNRLKDRQIVNKYHAIETEGEKQRK